MSYDQKDKDQDRAHRRAETADAALDAAKETAGLAADWMGVAKLMVAAAVIGGAAGTVGGVVAGGASGAAVTALSEPEAVIAPTDVVTENAELAPKLRVESQPTGATILIDGAPAGTTPAELSPAVGTHRIELTAEGFVPYQLDVELRDGIASHVNVSLRPESPEEEEPVRAGAGRGRARGPSCGNQLERCRSGCRDSTSYCRDRECSLNDSSCQSRCDSMERMCREQCFGQFNACQR